MSGKNYTGTIPTIYQKMPGIFEKYKIAWLCIKALKL